jgi:hypothetical protein
VLKFFYISLCDLTLAVYTDGSLLSLAPCHEPHRVLPAHVLQGVLHGFPGRVTAAIVAPAARPVARAGSRGPRVIPATRGLRARRVGAHRVARVEVQVGQVDNGQGLALRQVAWG